MTTQHRSSLENIGCCPEMLPSLLALCLCLTFDCVVQSLQSCKKKEMIKEKMNFKLGSTLLRVLLDFFLVCVYFKVILTVHNVYTCCFHLVHGKNFLQTINASVNECGIFPSINVP
jgi:hypothetical protein